MSLDSCNCLVFLSQTTGFQWPRDLALCVFFFVVGKIWPPTGSFSKIIVLKRSAPIKNCIPNVNHVIFGRTGRVYLYLSWLPLGCRDPEAAERTETKFSLIHSVTVLLHFSKHIISLVSCEKGHNFPINMMLMNFGGFQLMSAEPCRSGHRSCWWYSISVMCHFLLYCFYAPKMLLKQNESRSSNFEHTSIGEMVFFSCFLRTFLLKKCNTSSVEIPVQHKNSWHSRDLPVVLYLIAPVRKVFRSRKYSKFN